MKHLKNFENKYYEHDIEKIIPKEKVYAIFEKYSLSCDPKQNKHLNRVEYDDESMSIMCNFTTYTYDGRVDNKILDTLQKIMYDMNAGDFTFGNYSRFGSYLVTFIYTDEKLEECEIKNNTEKYNL